MMDDHDLEPGLIERLASLDDRLRQGNISTELIEEELATLEADAELAALAGCVKVLEQRWPRTPVAGARSPPAGMVAAIHPVIRWSISSGGEEPRLGKFAIKGELGRGGFGVVYLAEDTVLSREVALKLPRPELFLDEALKRRFLQEGIAAAAIDHPHVAAVYEAGEIESLCYLAMAYCPGQTLAAWLTSNPKSLSPRQAARLVETLALALDYIHARGILHRDMKPGNVLLWPSPEAAGGRDELPFVPKLTDFGLSKVLAESIAESRSSVLMGTPLYMAPEQAEGRLSSIGPATDVFALGVILYELLTGQLPFASASVAELFDKIRNVEPQHPRATNPAVPNDLGTICLKCLEKQPEERYRSAQALADDLRRYLDGENIVARPMTMGRHVLRWCQQPERIRDAGLIVMGVNTAIPVGMILSLLMVQAGNVIQRPPDFTLTHWYPAMLNIILTSHGPMVVVGRLVMAGYQWAAWLSFSAGVLMTVAAVCFMTGHIPMGTTGWDEIPGFRILYPLIVPLVLLQALISAVALIAMFRARRNTYKPRMDM